jgi:thiosulfate/3-mercaptopyruvate sulfurtransferase
LTDGLVTVAWLADRLLEPSVLVADCRWYLDDPERGGAAYAESHIPGAVFVDLEHELSAPEGPGRHPLPARESLAATLGSKGVGSDMSVVAYDDRGGAVAARLWWMLRWLGHEDAAVLDGGLTAWVEAGLPTTSAVPERPAARVAVEDPLTRTIDRHELQGRIGSVALVDARDADRYRGEREPVDAAAGHIPTAINVPYSDNLDTTLRFRPAEALAGLYPDGEVVVYCGSGVTACHDILAMRLAGRAEPILYPGSWSDWSATGGAVATGSQP